MPCVTCSPRAGDAALGFPNERLPSNESSAGSRLPPHGHPPKPLRSDFVRCASSAEHLCRDDSRSSPLLRPAAQTPLPEAGGLFAVVSALARLDFPVPPPARVRGSTSAPVHRRRGDFEDRLSHTVSLLVRLCIGPLEAPAAVPPALGLVPVSGSGLPPERPRPPPARLPSGFRARPLDRPRHRRS